MEECSQTDGLWLPGTFCGDENACPMHVCFIAAQPCNVPSFDPGCNDVECCLTVCALDEFCCEIAWDETCVQLAKGHCHPPVFTYDHCEGALLVPCDGSDFLINPLATDEPSDPGFSCHSGGEGQNGVGSVWARFIATATSARLRTCDSIGGADDSLLAVYSGGCGNLHEIGCSDDIPGCASTNFNSEICVSGLTPGQWYIVQLAAWTNLDRGRYLLEIDCPSTCTPPLNDDCAQAQSINDGIFPYSCGGAFTDGPALPAVCDEGDGLDLQHDVWFDYTATVSGTATVDLCSGVSFDSRLAVYAGCDCAVSNATLVGCNDDSQFCGTEVNGGSRFRFPVTMGQCYKIRVGGHGDVSGSGLLVMSSDGTMNCPSGNVVFVAPSTGTVDARQPHPIDSPSPLLGIQTFTATGPPNAHPACWRMCETTSVPGSPNSIQIVIADGANYTIALARPITPGAVTRLSYHPSDGVPTVGTFISHPGNVNGDATASPVDILRLIDCLNSELICFGFGVYSRDIDHSGLFAPADILREIDLINGAGAFDVWNGTQLPTGECLP
jgi:hypothetical protein